MALIALFKRPGPSGFGFASSAEQVSEGVDLRGRTALVTGSNSGLGLETCRVLAKRGARVLALARSESSAQKAASEAGFEVVPVACELGDLGSVRRAVETARARADKIDILIANAGIMALPQRELIHGVEKQLFVNHFGHFTLVTGLLDRLSSDARVVILTSNAHTRAPAGGVDLEDLGMEKGYTPWVAYGQSKTANLLFARQLARRFRAAGEKRRANGVHPGVIATNLTRQMPAVAQWGWALMSPLFLKTIPQGAATQVWAAVHPGAAEVNGEYLSDCNVATSMPYAADMALAARLWEVTEARIAAIGG